MVEHDPDIMRASDRILDLGPGAGENGGKVIATGTFNRVRKNPASSPAGIRRKICNSTAQQSPETGRAADQNSWSARRTT